MIRLIHPDGHSERLRWTDRHPASHYGLGVVLRGHSGRHLDGQGFRILSEIGYRITCTDERERRRVAGALGWAALQIPPDRLTIAAA